MQEELHRMQYVGDACLHFPYYRPPVVAQWMLFQHCGIGDDLAFGVLKVRGSASSYLYKVLSRNLTRLLVGGTLLWKPLPSDMTSTAWLLY